MSLSVVDSNNNGLPDVSISYQVNGGAVNTQACGPNGTCAIGEDLSGDFSITATKQGYASNSGAVTVGADRCHVRPERLTIVLQTTAQAVN